MRLIEEYSAEFQNDFFETVPQTWGEAIKKYPWISRYSNSETWDNYTSLENCLDLIGFLICRVSDLESRPVGRIFKLGGGGYNIDLRVPDGWKVRHDVDFDRIREMLVGILKSLKITWVYDPYPIVEIDWENGQISYIQFGNDCTCCRRDSDGCYSFYNVDSVYEAVAIHSFLVTYYECMEHVFSY